MRVIVGSIFLAVVVALAAGGVYWAVQTPVYINQPMPSVRVGDPGENLVGPRWTGNPPGNQGTEGEMTKARRAQAGS